MGFVHVVVFAMVLLMAKGQYAQQQYQQQYQQQLGNFFQHPAAFNQPSPQTNQQQSYQPPSPPTLQQPSSQPSKPDQNQQTNDPMQSGMGYNNQPLGSPEPEAPTESQSPPNLQEMNALVQKLDEDWTALKMLIAQTYGESSQNQGSSSQRNDQPSAPMRQQSPPQTQAEPGKQGESQAPLQEQPQPLYPQGNQGFQPQDQGNKLISPDVNIQPQQNVRSQSGEQKGSEMTSKNTIALINADLTDANISPRVDPRVLTAEDSAGVGNDGASKTSS